MEKYNIKDGRYIFNLDETGISIKTLLRKAFQKGVGVKGRPLYGMDAPVKGNIEHVTIMPVISAAGGTASSLAVLPRKQPHWRRVSGTVQSVHNFLLPGSMLFHRDPAGVDGDIFEEWARSFVSETEGLRQNGQKILLVLDGFGAHRRYSTLQLLRDNNIIVVGLPAHCSHVLQPLDVSVFGPFKQYLRNGLVQAIQGEYGQKLDVFHVCKLITSAYNKALTPANIISGVLRTGIWDNTTLKPSLAAMEQIGFTSGSGTEGVTDVSEDDVQLDRNERFKDFVTSYRKRRREILACGAVDTNGTVQVDCIKGVHLTSDSILQALRSTEERRLERVKDKQERHKQQERRKEDRLSAALRRDEARQARRRKQDESERKALLQLAPIRMKHWADLNNSRDLRRRIRVMRAAELSAQTSLLIL